MSFDYSTISNLSSFDSRDVNDMEIGTSSSADSSSSSSFTALSLLISSSFSSYDTEESIWVPAQMQLKRTRAGIPNRISALFLKLQALLVILKLHYCVLV